MPTDTELAKFFVHLTETLSLTQQEAAAKIGRKHSTISRWKGGTVPEMTPKTRKAVEDFIYDVANTPEPKTWRDAQAKGDALEALKAWGWIQEG